MKKFPKIQLNDSALSRMQENLSNALDPLLSKPLSDSNLLQDIAVLSGPNRISHGLNRPLVGWIVTRQNADASFYDGQDTNPLSERVLILYASADATIDLIVF